VFCGIDVSWLAKKLFSTGPGIFRRAERKETIIITDGLKPTSCDSLFQSETVLEKISNLLITISREREE